MRSCLFYILVALHSAACSQRISELRLTPENGAVHIKFNIAPGPQCNGYNISHSTDSIAYLVIDPGPGICGDPTATEPKSFIHNNPLRNQVNYYKVELFGPYEVAYAKVYVGDNNASNLFIYPNPLYNDFDPLRMRIWNTGNVRLVGDILNQFGTPVMPLDFVTQGDTGTLDVAGLGNGFYVVWLTDGSNLYRAKFVINR